MTRSGGLAALDRDGIDVAVLSLQTTLGIEALPASERDELELAWVDGIRQVVRESDGRFRALAPWRVVDGFDGTSAGASAAARARGPHARSSTRSTPPAAFSSSIRSRRGRCLPAVPAGGAGRSATRGRCSGRTSPGSPTAASAYRRPRSCSRSSRAAARSSSSACRNAGSRCAPRSIRASSSTPRRTAAGRSSSASRPSARASSSYGSDMPVVDPRLTLQAVRGFGDAVARLLQIDTPGALLP